MNMNSAIRVDKLSKQYLIKHQQDARYATFSESLTRMGKNLLSFGKKSSQTENETAEIFWALRDVSFNVAQGDRLGVIGRNGAGKSTLLKVLSRITQPSSGEVGIKGKVSSLLEVGTGFHPELTGRENIFLNGAILGMTRRDIYARFDEIVAFSEVEQFLDTPVKRFSSGMYVRLAFAVAAHLETEILIVDEVLAVGDAQFQNKCLGKLKDIGNSGRTVIFVSHSMGSIRDLCSSCLVMKGGAVDFDGGVDDAIARYYSESSLSDTRLEFPEIENAAQLTSVEMCQGAVHSVGSYEVEEPVSMEIRFSVKSPGNLFLGIELINWQGQTVLFWRDMELLKQLTRKAAGHYGYRITIPAHTLAPGKYRINLALADYDIRRTIHQPVENVCFTLHDSTSYRAAKGLIWRGVCATPMEVEVLDI
jgi:lipopolysaccharide transport system ATP-binding protein